MISPQLGPVEILVVRFPGNQFKGEIAPALNDLVQSDTIRIIDLLFAIKDETGEFQMVDVKQLKDRELAVFEPLVEGGTELLTEDDVEQVAEMLEPNSAAAVLLFENFWAKRFRDALLNANAEMIFNARIPYQQIEEFLAERDKEIAAEEAVAAPA